MIVESSVNINYTNYYREIQKLRYIHAIAHHPNFKKALNLLFNDEAFIHPLKILRTIFPAAQIYYTSTSGFFHVRGTEDTWTNWVSLGDCPEELGGPNAYTGISSLGFVTLTSS